MPQSFAGRTIRVSVAEPREFSFFAYIIALFG